MKETYICPKCLYSVNKNILFSICPNCRFSCSDYTGEKKNRRYEKEIIGKTFSDRIDATATTSLYEYGFLRRPYDGKTLCCLNPSSEEHTEGYPPRIEVLFISLEDVITEVNNSSKGFFEFIGDKKENVLKDLDNDNLSWIIHALNMYHGYTDNQLLY